MNIQVKSSHGIALIPAETRLLADRKVFIEGEINYETASEFVKSIMLLVKENSEQPIDVFITSHGGIINAGLMMYDAIQSCKTPIRMYCLGTAYSMAAVLFACGRHGRFMLPNSELMLHEPLISNGVSGNASSIQSISESLLASRKKMNAILAKHTGKTEKEIEEATRFDHYYSAEESIEFGLADEIIGFDKIMEG